MASMEGLRIDRSLIPTQPRDVERFLKSDSCPVDTSLPPGFPKVVDSKTAWSGENAKFDPSTEQHTLILSEAEIGELEEGCRMFKELNLPFDAVSEKTLPLPTLSAKLKAWASELTQGVGFFRIRGLNPQQYSSEKNILMYLGICAYVAEKRGMQDERGNMLLHLTDVGPQNAGINERQAPYSNISQPYHTDAGGLIALYSLGQAETGGNSQLVPMATVYNEIAATRPDIIRLLASHTWVFDSFGLTPAYNVRPLLYPLKDGKVMFAFARRPLLGSSQSPRSEGVPELSDAHVEALNAVQFVAAKHALSTSLPVGEMLFWNNLSMLHSRQGFTDGGAGKRRHLIRLWLCNEATLSGWSIPEEIKAGWDDAFELDGREQKWPLDPITDREFITYQARASGHD
ncbi:taurine catabolism dioxygenase TauD [Drepanopeziza brunnea f. sp. 'multigermtubi' MB_m1]|uniref:Taurine catabolism dioxygenase TauD n=1 Tax=Marssonina brunnea f. sp. multigermtubi (strain MB_m1) TaxID=1072389 RepID=K1X5C0_MARBU|nr:taurine catabolism dioxygenase TauD [Drepanopeziza brunnea f. sp. 'multigermtubi' MB_m1]EKD20346.1 taurine catabolism dioxygenase TauD [Drepanopeziza brunnea f. sp. 'multigermtubi' MB_m1]